MIHCLALAMCIMAASAAQAETILTLGEAERIFLESNLELQAKRAELPRYDAEALGAALLPNPSFSYRIESVEDGDRETEQIYALSMPMDFIWKRTWKRNVAEKRRDARRLMYEQDKADALFVLRDTYYKILLLRQNEKTLKDFLGKFGEFEETTRERFDAGDVPELDIIKLSAERSRIVRRIRAAQSEADVETNKLALMLNIEGGELVCSGSLTFVPLRLTIDELLARAVRERADVRASEAAADSSRANLTLAEREALPAVGIEAGYKTVTGGFKGFVLGVLVPLPIFNRNQSGVASATAELNSELTAYELRRTTASYEVKTIYGRLSRIEDRVRDIEGQLAPSREVTSITRVAYEEGESSLLDVLDAVRSEIEIQMEYHAAVHDHMTAVSELERATGTRLTGDEGRL